MPKPTKPYRNRQLGDRKLAPETLAMSYGYDPAHSEGALKAPIFQTSTFAFGNADDGKAMSELAYGLRDRRADEDPGSIYTRINNPGLEILEDRLTLWDEAEAALVFASGMAAISTTLLTHVRPGEVIVHSEPLYGGTTYLVHTTLPEFGVRHVGFQAGTTDDSLDRAVDAALGLGPVAVIYAETPANPTNAMVDIAACAAAAERIAAAQGRKPLLVVDNTLLGPLWQKPFEHGADLVVYALTKYMGGHSDVIAGACLGREDVMLPIRVTRTVLGTTMDAHTAWLVTRSLETMTLRMTKATDNTRRVAAWLAEQPKVASVNFPDLFAADDPRRAVFARQCTAAGSTFAFDLDGGEAACYRLLNALKVIRLAVSLGGTESLAEHPASMTHVNIPPDAQAAIGITPGMTRMSIGIEDPDDLIADLEQALAAV